MLVIAPQTHARTVHDLLNRGATNRLSLEVAELCSGLCDQDHCDAGAIGRIVGARQELVR
jgi:hypothetical protein